MDLLLARTLLWEFFFKTLTDCRAMSINTDIRELLILRKNVKPSHFHAVTEMGNERKSLSYSQSSGAGCSKLTTS